MVGILGYELDWDEVRKRWGVWNTVVCDFIGYATTPEAVADIVTKDKDYYYCSVPFPEHERYRELKADLVRLEREVATGEHPRAVIAKQIESVKMEMERLKPIAERPMICVYHPGLTTESKPDPRAKEEIRQSWIEEAKKAREEKRRVTLVCEITPEGEVRRLLP